MECPLRRTDADGAGAQAWHLQLDVHALDHDGNLLDACMLSALAALMAFRRPDTEVVAPAPGEGAPSTVTLLSPDVREPLPLSLHQLPLAVTFALFEVGRPSHEGCLFGAVRHSSRRRGQCSSLSEPVDCLGSLHAMSWSALLAPCDGKAHAATFHAGRGAAGGGPQLEGGGCGCWSAHGCG